MHEFHLLEHIFYPFLYKTTRMMFNWLKIMFSKIIYNSEGYLSVYLYKQLKKQILNYFIIIEFPGNPKAIVLR